MASHPSPTPPLRTDRFSNLPQEIRNIIYELILGPDFTAVVLPAVVGGLVCSDGSAPQIKYATVSGFSCVSKLIATEYGSIVEAAAHKLEGCDVLAHVMDLDYENLIEGFLTRLQATARDHYDEVPIAVKLTFTAGFELVSKAAMDARVQRWLQYRQMTEDEGLLVPLTIEAHDIGGPCSPVRDFFNHLIHAGYEGRHFVDLVSAVRQAFAPDMTYRGWKGLEKIEGGADLDDKVIEALLETESDVNQRLAAAAEVMRFTKATPRRSIRSRKGL